MHRTRHIKLYLHYASIRLLNLQAYLNLFDNHEKTYTFIGYFILFYIRKKILFKNRILH